MASFEEFRVSVRANPSRFGMLGALVVFAVYLLNYQGPGAIPSDARMLVTGLLLAQRPVEVVDPGGRAWRVEPAPRTPDAALSLGHGTAATGDLCIGAAMILAPALRLAGPLAAHIAYALLPALLSLLVYGTATRVFGRRWLAFVAQLLVALNPFMLSFQGLHPAFFSAPLGAAVMFLLVGPPRHRVLLGMLFGALVAVENASLLLAAPILVMLATEGGEPLALRLGGLLRVVAAALLVLAPALWWKELAFGSMLMHPREALPASALRFPHGVFHWTWEQAALLNYPLGPEVVRTPHFPFPGFLGLPLALARGFGLLLASCFFLGAGPLLREDRRLARFLLSWVVLFYLWWGFQEDWDESRTAGVLIAVPAVVLLMASGILRFGHMGSLRRNLVRLGGVAMLLVVMIRGTMFMEFPPDPRWSLRHPEAAANACGVDGLPPDRRLSPLFHCTAETPAELRDRKHLLIAGNLLPAPYLPLRGPPSRGVEVLLEAFRARGAAPRVDGALLGPLGFLEKSP